MEPQPGYRVIWHPESDWVVDGEGRACRMPGCPKLAVAKFLRPIYATASRRRHWWHYCADHLYGRIIHSGTAYASRLIAEDEPLPDGCFEDAAFKAVT